MTVHFANEELAARRKAVADELADRGLDGLLAFRQKSMYYLTGYDTFGYVFFQRLYVGADGETMTLLTRTPDLRQAEHTSVIKDIRLWYDAEGVNPAEDLRRILDEHGTGGKRLGIETDAYGLTGYNLKRVEAALSGFCELVEASDLVTGLRMVKAQRGYEISLEVTEGFPFAPLGEVGTQMLRIIREALTNARRHSGAHNVQVTLSKEGDELVVKVSDDRGDGDCEPPAYAVPSGDDRDGDGDGCAGET